LATRLYMVGTMYSDANDRRRAAAAHLVDDLKSLFDDLRICLEDTFTFTTEQKVCGSLICIFTVAQDIIYQGNHMSFTKMHIDMESTLNNEQIPLKLTNVFGRPLQERQLTSLTQKVASSVRNTFCQDLCNSVLGPSTMSLADFTYQSACKYKHGGPGDKLDQLFIIHNALLVSHPHL
ncbi:hypothetical protein B0H34DRAFT_664710, partial [Crassisporium funariophilum]